VDSPERFESYTESAGGSSFGTVFDSRAREDPALGVRAFDPHANSMGRVHGGPLVAPAETDPGDFAKSIITGQALEATVDMNVSFMEDARIDQWFVVHPSLDRKGQSMIVDSREIRADDSVTKKVSAIFFIHYHPRTDREEIT